MHPQSQSMFTTGLRLVDCLATLFTLAPFFMPVSLRPGKAKSALIGQLSQVCVGHPPPRTVVTSQCHGVEGTVSDYKVLIGLSILILSLYL